MRYYWRMSRFFALLSCVALSLLACSSSGVSLAQNQYDTPEPPKKSNVVTILLDDATIRDAYLMPTINREITGKGTRFRNAFVSYSLCCPSRTTFLTGAYPHNHGVLLNSFDDTRFGSEGFAARGRDGDTTATRLQADGYETMLAGTYFPSYNDPEYVPPGWDRWRAFTSGGLSVDGEFRARPKVPIDEWAGNEAVEFIREAEEPFYLNYGSHAPHGPYQIPERFSQLYADATPPRSPSYDEADVSDKPGWVRDKPRLTTAQKISITSEYRDRLRSLRVVDEAVGKILEALRDTGELDNTYIVLSSDNGYQFGSHRLRGKWTAYEEAIRVPMIVRGPRIPEGGIRDQMVLNNDVAATVAGWTGTEPPAISDGESFAPQLASAGAPGRSRFLVESWRDPEWTNSPPTYKAIRTKNWKYVEYVNGDRELYNLSTDSRELRNIYPGVSAQVKREWTMRLDRLRDCAGNECRAAEGFTP